MEIIDLEQENMMLSVKNPSTIDIAGQLKKQRYWDSKKQNFSFVSGV